MPLADTLIGQQKRVQQGAGVAGGGGLFGGLAGSGGGGAPTGARGGGGRQGAGSRPGQQLVTPAQLTKPKWLQALEGWWQEGAQGPKLGQQGIPASMMGGDLAIGSALIPGSRPVLNQPLATSNRAEFERRNQLGAQAANAALNLDRSIPRAGASSLASGFFNWLNPSTGQTEQIPLPDDITQALRAAGPEPAPIGGTGDQTILPDTYRGQLQRWRQQLNAILGVTGTILPDTWLGQQSRILEQYYGANPYEPAAPGSDYWGYPSYGGGGGGGGNRDPMFWLDRVKWNIV